nr:putative ribonuclease H-like domain-containing protein [Tanacetum cinerariifolium]
MIKDEADNEVEVPPVTVHQILARTRERKSKSTLLMAIPDEHLARFNGIKVAKTLWAAIKTRFGAHSRSNSTKRVNTARSKAVSVVKGNEVTAVKASAGCVWRPRVNKINQISKDNSFDLQNVVPSGDLTCLFAKASIDESILWHRRLGHVNFKTMNKLVKRNLVRVTDDFSRFGWVFFLATKDETSKVLKLIITAIENQINKKVKVIRCDNGTEFKNMDLDEFYEMKGIKREYSNARTLQQNGVAERNNRTLIDADLLLPITFWVEVVNTACYVLNRALVTKPHNQTPYELLNGRSPRLDFMRPFGCPVTILNTLDPLGKFKGKADEEFLVEYSVTSKAFRGIKLTKMLVHKIQMAMQSSDDKVEDDTCSKTVVEPVNKEDQTYRDELDMLISKEKDASDAADSLSKEFEQGCMDQRGAPKAGSTNSFNTVSTSVNAARTLGTFSAGGPSSPHPDAFIPDDTLLYVDQDDSQIPDLEDTAELRSTCIFTSAYYDDLDTFTSLVQSVGTEADFNNMESSTIVSLILTHRVHMDHPKDQILRDLKSAVQTRGMEKKSSGAHAFVAQALDDESWVEAMQDELLQFSLQKVWRLVDLPYGKNAIGTKWVYRNKKDERGILVRNKVRLVAQGNRQEEGIDYDENGYRRGIVDKTFFIKTDKDDIMIVQVYVDDIIFGSTKKSLCDEFEDLMHKRFQMSSMGELTFLLGLHVKQTSTLIETQKPLVKDEEAADADVYLYRSMIGSLMYLRASRPDIMFAVCACSRFQVTPKLSHLYAMKRIFRYLKGQSKLGLWYLRDSPFDLEAYSDSDYAGANLDRKSTTEEYVAVANCCRQGKNGEKLVSAAGYGLYCLAKLSAARQKGEGSGWSRVPRNHGGAMAQIRPNGAPIQSSNPPLSTGNTVRSGEDMMEHEVKLMDLVPQTPHDSPLSGGHTLGSDEVSMTLKELIVLYITLSQKVLDVEKVKTAQEKEGRKNFKSQQKFQDINDLVDEEMIVEDKGSGEKGGNTAKTVSTARLDISAARAEVSTAEPKTPPTTTTLFDDEDVIIVDTLVKMKNKGKGILQDPEPVKKTKKRDQGQIKRDAKVALKIQAVLDEEVRIERERQKEAFKAALAGLYDEVQAQIDADHELVAKLPYEEQEKYTVEERSKLLAEFFERRKKRLAKERAEAIRSKPPIKTLLRNLMMTYLEHTSRFTHAQLKSRSFEEIQKLYTKEHKWVDAFVPIGSEEDEERVKSRKKRVAGSSLKQKSSKKQKVNDQESVDSDKELRICLKVVLDDDKAINYETLDVKSLIVDYESQKLGIMEAGDVYVYKFTRLDGSYRHFSTFSRMLEVLDRQDVLDLHKIVMERFPSNDPEGYDLILWGDLKTLMKSSKDDEI